MLALLMILIIFKNNLKLKNWVNQYQNLLSQICFRMIILVLFMHTIIFLQSFLSGMWIQVNQVRLNVLGLLVSLAISKNILKTQN